jgi:heme exporter protein CcmD
MSDHAFYLWGSYSVTFVLLLVEIVLVLKRKRETKT